MSDFRLKMYSIEDISFIFLHLEVKKRVIIFRKIILKNEEFILKFAFI